MFHAVEVHILERIYLCETVAVVDASGAFDKMGVFAAVIFGKIAAAGEKGHLKFAVMIIRACGMCVVDVRLRSAAWLSLPLDVPLDVPE